jgi:epoxyqueuosine reductase QueG
MKEKFVSILNDYLEHHSDGECDFAEGRSYGRALFGFASIDDPLFRDYKGIIGEEHLTPKEAFEQKFGETLEAGTVISIALPVNAAVAKSNRGETSLPSKEWTLGRTFIDDVYKTKIGVFLCDTLTELGGRAFVPSHDGSFRVKLGARTFSTWSERHIAYAAGLGTFSINEALITEAGIAVRLLSAVTDLVLPPSPRPSTDYRANCLFCRNGTCGACMKRCPAHAITPGGHDKFLCYQWCYGPDAKALAVSRGAVAKNGAGCGLCQTAVPCEYRNPVRAMSA